MPEDSQEDSTETEDITAMPKLSMGLIGLAIVVFCFGIALLLMRGQAAPNISAQIKSPHQAYLEILGETHTGLRLVRLDDFVTNVAANENTPYAQTARNALAAQEQKAWAHLTDALYDLKKTEAEKITAFAAYKQIWGVWSRQEDLPKLLDTTQSVTGISAHLQYAPNSRRSQFGKNDAETVLAGGASSTIVRPQMRVTPTAPLAVNVKKARIKYAKRPRYPRKARRKGIEASITLSLDIDERGNVARAKVVSIQTTRYKDKFIRAARRAAMASKFHPKTINGTPVASRGYVRQYTFRAGE